MKLCIAEKPSVAKEIARILKANTRKDGYFEGNGYQITWTFGHLCTLKNPEDYTTDWKAWRMHFLPMIPPRFGIKLIENEGIQKQFSIIKHLVAHCSEVINCGDAGIEGELIQRWVLTKAECAKPLKRLWISSMTDEAIHEGFQKLQSGEQFDRLYAAGNARAIGDWLLGMNASRLYTLKYANGKGVLSIGRVQTPTLALIVSRYLEIQQFVSKPFWEIKTVYRTVLFTSTMGRFETAEEAREVIVAITSHLFEVVAFEQKKGTEAPPKLFDLTSLQVECNKKYGFTADETLTSIQTLYEKKMVTYPRVDTTFLPLDVYPKVPDILKKMEPYKQWITPLLDKPIKKSKKVFDDTKITDHHAIIPTGVSPTGLQLPEKRVCDTIARRFIAVFYPDCIVQNTTVIGNVAGYEFKATGKIILEDGWRVLYPKKDADSDTEQDDEQIMPRFEKGETGEHEPDILEKQTQPPKMHTEATLLRAMETAGKQVDDDELREILKENGIGRPSTRANIIETLCKRKFIVREKKNIVPTQTGIQLIQTIQNELLKSAELTGLWEQKLRLIEKGEYDAKQFLDEMKLMVTQLVQEVKQEQFKQIEIEQDDTRVTTIINEETPKKTAKKTVKKKVDSIPITEMKCPVCGKGTLLKGKTAYGCSQYKTGCTYTIAFVQNGKTLSDKEIVKLINRMKIAD